MPESYSALGGLDDEQRAEYWAALALRRTPGLGVRSICRLLKYFGSAYAAVYAVARWQEAGVSPQKGAALGGDAWRQEARPEWEDARDLEGEILLWTDPRYPSLLRELPDAPALLYAKGNTDLLLKPCLAVVGSRGCTQSGSLQSGELARDLSSCGICVVSGMARGIDRAAHEGALQEQGSSIAVLGSGVDVIYPRQCTALYRRLCRDGLVLSEFPPGTLPQGPLFPVRNRIISGLSLGVIVTEATVKSGSLVTARLALEQNRHVFALLPPDALQSPSPAPISEGCSLLIDQGARAVRHARDILREIWPLLTVNKPRLVLSRPAAPADSVPRQQELVPRSSLFSRPAPQDTPEAAPSPSHRHKKSVHAQKKNAPAAPLPAPEAAADNAPHLSSFAADSPEHQVLSLLLRQGSMNGDALLEALPAGSSLNAGTLSAVLLMLEVQGAVKLLPGNVYEVNCRED